MIKYAVAGALDMGIVATVLSSYNGIFGVALAFYFKSRDQENSSNIKGSKDENSPTLSG